MSAMENRCIQIQVLLPDYVDGELSAAESARIEAHLAGCLECGSEIGFLRATRFVIAHRIPDVHPPAALYARVARATTARPTWPQRLRALVSTPSSTRLAVGTALAGVITLAVVLPFSTHHIANLEGPIPQPNLPLAAAPTPPRPVLPHVNKESSRNRPRLAEVETPARTKAPASVRSVQAAPIHAEETTPTTHLTDARPPSALAEKSTRTIIVATGPKLSRAFNSLMNRGNLDRAALVTHSDHDASGAGKLNEAPATLVHDTMPTIANPSLLAAGSEASHNAVVAATTANDLVASPPPAQHFTLAGAGVGRDSDEHVLQASSGRLSGGDGKFVPLVESKTSL